MLILSLKKYQSSPSCFAYKFTEAFLAPETIWFVSIATQMEAPQVPGEGRCQDCKALRGNPKLHYWQNGDWRFWVSADCKGGFEKYLKTLWYIPLFLPAKQEGKVATLEPWKQQQSNAEKSLLFRKMSWVLEIREAHIQSAVCREHFQSSGAQGRDRIKKSAFQLHLIFFF